MGRFTRAALAIAIAAKVAACTLFTDLEGLEGDRAPSPDVGAPDVPASSEVGLGDGKRGSRTIASPEVVNEYAALARDAPSGATTLRVEDDVAFADGDAVLVWQTTGLVQATSGDQSLTLLRDDVGRWEIVRVVHALRGELTLARPLAASYRAVGGQVVRVPEYEELTIASSGSVEGMAWDGVRGGVVAVLVRGTLRNDGAVHADRIGFRGGRTIQNQGVDGCGEVLDGQPANGFAAKGESFVPSAFSASADLAATGGRGNILSGGGGGNCHNGGGGGGGNGGGGGRGGNAGSPMAPTAVGGLGGAPISGSLLDRLTLGGGGGAGDQNESSNATNGGTGGGVVLVRARGIDGSGVFAASGESPGNTGEDGASGGGAGGSVLLQVVEAARCRIQARGGNGGSVTLEYALGPGGGGGGGRALVQGAFVECPADVVSGIAGTQPTTKLPPNAGAEPVTPEPGYVEVPPGAGYVP